MHTLLMAATIATLVACGSPAPPASTMPEDTGLGNDRHATRHSDQPLGTGSGSQAETDDDGGATGTAMANEMTDMPAPVAKFHSVLAPRWHAARGPKRMADTCAAIGEMRTDAEAIVATPPPGGADPTAWSAHGKQLNDSVTALDATCRAKDAAAFEPAFAAVHKHFHGLMADVGRPHGHGGEHADEH